MPYTTIAVPIELRDKIKEIAAREGKSSWRIIEEAIGLYYGQKKKPTIKSDLSIVDKLSWYVIKVSMSVGAFKENPTDQNLVKLERTLMQISKRIKWVPFHTVNLLLKNARQYLAAGESERKRYTGEINMALKMLIIDMFSIPEESIETISSEEDLI